jgi:hypothetical protein
MPEADLEAVKRALGNICLDVDGNQEHESPKLASVKPGSVEAYYMVAAFCFNLTRKLHYMFKATKGFAGNADGKLAQEIKKDNEYLYDRSMTTWKERAERAEKVMLRLYGDIHEEYERLLEEAAKKR